MSETFKRNNERLRPTPEYIEGIEQCITLPDGRRMAYKNLGRQSDYPVIFLHGTPGSKDGPLPRSMRLRLRKTRLIVPDRAGYGGSDRHPNRSVGSIAEDITFLANELGLQRFSVVGRSGGAPHALACGALLPDSVESVIALVSIAPPDAEGLDWFEGMTTGNMHEYALVDKIIKGDQVALHAAETLRANTVDAMMSGNFVDASLLYQLPTPDRRVIADVAIRNALNTGFVNAVARNPIPTQNKAYASGQFDDLIAFRTDWGFDVGQIACPTYLWHGVDDVFSPISHSSWLAKKIPGSILDAELQKAHFGAIEALPELLNWANWISQQSQL